MTGRMLSEVIPPASWHELRVAERRRRIEEAADLLRRELGVKRPTPIMWVDDPANAGVGYDEQRKRETFTADSCPNHANPSRRASSSWPCTSKKKRSMAVILKKLGTSGPGTSV